MTEQEIAERILRQVTGNKVCSELSLSDVIALVNDAFLEAKPWFDEPDRLATFVVNRTDTRAGYVDMSDVEPSVRKVRGVIPIRLEKEYTGDIVRDLLLLPASPLDTRSIVEQAYWEMAWPMVKNLLGRDLRFRFDKPLQRVFVDDVIEQSLTVVWVPDIESVSQVTYQKALTWIYEMAKAFVMEALANIRGKFRGGALRFETDASEMLSTANERQRDLREQLKELQFTLAVR